MALKNPCELCGEKTSSPDGVCAECKEKALRKLAVHTTRRKQDDYGETPSGRNFSERGDFEPRTDDLEDIVRWNQDNE